MADFTTRIVRDAVNQKLIIEVVDTSNPPSQQASYGIIELNLAHVLGKHIKGREWAVCDAEGAPGFAVFLSSEWYADALDV